MGDIFSRIEHSRTADEVAEQIENLILEGVLRVADRLPGERELARQFDVSRPILRDALKSLEGRGLLTTRHGGGTHVGDVIGEVFTPPVMELITTRRKAAADYMEYRREMEAITADYAARRATAEDLALLTGIMTRMAAAHKSGDATEEAAIDVEFHSAVGECAHNIVFLHTLRSCYRLLSQGVLMNRTMIYDLPGVRDAIYDQHRAIHAAIVKREPVDARDAAVAHIDFVRSSMAEAEKTGDWQRVSRLRLKQRGEASENKARKNASD